MIELTTEWNARPNQNTRVCWPFKVMPYDGEMTVVGTEYIAVTFDGSAFKMYANDTTSNDVTKMYHRPDYVVTRTQTQGSTDALYISRGNRAICHFPFAPTPQQKENGYYTWENNRWMQFISLGEGGIFIHWVTERSIEFWRDLR